MSGDDNLVPVPPSRIRWVFVGEKEIRAGWSISIFFVILGVLTAAFFFPVKSLLETNHFSLDDATPVSSAAGELAGLLALIGASIMMALIEHKPLISYGLEGPRRLALFGVGLICGFAALALLVGALALGGYLSLDGQVLHGPDVWEYALEWGVVFLMVGAYEEYFLRGYMQATLARGIGFWWSAAILSILFGCSHLMNPGESKVGIVSAALVGFVFCISLWYLKNLWWAIGFHGAWDWGESYFWGTADSGRVVQGHLYASHPQGDILWSGGATGPEGSIMVIPLLLLVALLLWAVCRRAPGRVPDPQVLH